MGKELINLGTVSTSVNSKTASLMDLANSLLQVVDIMKATLKTTRSKEKVN